MKRPLQEPLLPAPTRPRLTDDVSSEYHHQQQIAEHYSNRLNQTVEERELSPIIHLKKLNNWIKSVLVQTYTKKGDSVIDIACGKGGDLIKWDKARIGYYLGLDIAEGSIEDARMRYNGEDGEGGGGGGGGGGNMKKRKKTGTFSFPARLICADCFAVSLEEILEEEEAPFDVCSCQFALHYSWVSEQRARLALRNAASVLKPGGFFIGTLPDANVLVRKLRDSPGLEFGNSCYSVRFGEYYQSKRFPSSDPFGIQYEFHLEDAVDCPEWLVPFHVLKALAAEYSLELVYKKNFHEFVHEHVKNPDFVELMRKLGALDSISNDEWDTAYIYMAFVFKKIGPSQLRGEKQTKRLPAPISPEEIGYVEFNS